MTELTPYIPTADEFARTRHPSEELKLSGDGIFATLQGEGASAGRPSVFVRLQNCNLHCGADENGWRCDAWYTWDPNTEEYWTETRLATVETVAGEIQTAWQSNFPDVTLSPNLVMTGGEPLLQQSKLAKLLGSLPGWNSEVETNGTVIPGEAFQNTQINCSPKLASSGNGLRARRRLHVLRAIAEFPNHWFKFVIANDDDITEVEQIMDSVNGGNFDRVLLMSEGVTGAELTRSDEKLAIAAGRLGCGMTARNHIYWFGDKRAT